MPETASRHRQLRADASAIAAKDGHYTIMDDAPMSMKATREGKLHPHPWLIVSAASLLVICGLVLGVLLTAYSSVPAVLNSRRLAEDKAGASEFSGGGDKPTNLRRP